jgi:hypothetical protein
MEDIELRVILILAHGHRPPGHNEVRESVLVEGTVHEKLKTRKQTKTTRNEEEVEAWNTWRGRHFWRLN